MNLLVDMPPDPADRNHSVRAALIGGASPEAYRTARERFGFDILNVYGMTEAESLILQRLGDGSPDGSLGTPGPDFDVSLLDDADRPVAQGDIGQICVRPRIPDVLFRGYEADDGSSVGATRNLWFHTGDLAREDDAGFMYFEGRTSDRIRRRGENVSGHELERLLSEHPGVTSVGAVAVPSTLGEDDIKVGVSVDCGSRELPDDFASWCKKHIPRFMLPRFVEVFSVLPMLPIGKPDKLRIAEMTPETIDLEALS